MSTGPRCPVPFATPGGSIWPCKYGSCYFWRMSRYSGCPPTTALTSTMDRSLWTNSALAQIKLAGLPTYHDRLSGCPRAANVPFNAIQRRFRTTANLTREGSGTTCVVSGKNVGLVAGRTRAVSKQAESYLLTGAFVNPRSIH